METKLETATLATGCFWCTEAVFKRLAGVYSVVPGYTGGNISNPTYEQVSRGNSGHAECIQIKFDPTIISFEKIIEVFWAVHDPTTLNRQGNDVGTQYRSAVFYHTQDQKQIVEKSKQKAREKFSDPIVTEIAEFQSFFPAEAEHLDFYDRNRTNPYCRLIIDPKITKFYKEFSAELKKEQL